MAFLIYLAQVSLYAAAMWVIYLIIWRNRPLHGYSRLYLLAGLILPVLLPFIHVPVSNHSVAAAYQVMLPEVSIGAKLQHQRADFSVSWVYILPALYSVVVIILAFLYMRAHIQISKMLKQGNVTKLDGYTIITDTGIGPGTLGRKIFFPDQYKDPVIVQHELAHIRSAHRYDTFLLQVLHIIFWASPAHWLLGGELKMVHEFEADGIAGKDIDPGDYASLLLSQSMGIAPSLTIAHSFFHHSLKRRIMMLQEIKTPKKATLLIAATVLTIALVSTAMLAQSKKSPIKKSSVSRSNAAATPVNMENVRMRALPKNGEIKILENGTIAFKSVEQMPEFNGDINQWLTGYLHYPDSARSRGEEGRSVVQFTVGEQGQILNPHLVRSSGHPLLDEEALRAVHGMPHWHPGLLKGKPVAVIFTLPISFQLEGGANGKEGC